MLINDLSIKLNRSNNTTLLKKENALYYDPFITAVLAGNDLFLTKRIHNSAKTYDILIR